MTSEERKEINRQRIIEVTLELFKKQGVLTTTIAQIAKAAHVVDKTVLNIFGTKDSLIIEVMIHLAQSMNIHIDELTSSNEYLAMTGLKQVIFLQTERAKILRSDPERILLLGEVNVIATRTKMKRESAQIYMDKLDFLFRVFNTALDRGERDGSIRSNLDRDSVLSMLVPIFRAFLQQLASVIYNVEFNKLVDVEKEVKMYLNAIYTALSAQD